MTSAAIGCGNEAQLERIRSAPPLLHCVRRSIASAADARLHTHRIARTLLRQAAEWDCLELSPELHAAESATSELTCARSSRNVARSKVML